jgi:hypothetical protein
MRLVEADGNQFGQVRTEAVAAQNCDKLGLVRRNLYLSRNHGVPPGSSIPIPASHNLAFSQESNSVGASTRGSEQPVRTDSWPNRDHLRTCLSRTQLKKVSTLYWDFNPRP